MEHEVFIPVPAETLREALRDHARVARCVPGLQQDADESARPLSGRLKVRVGGHTITYRGALTLTERSGAFTAKGEGAEVRGTGSAKLRVLIRLTETAGGTTVAFTATATSDGRLADIPATTAEAAARRLLDRFAAGLGKPGEGPGADPEADRGASAASAAGVAGADDDVTASGGTPGADDSEPQDPQDPQTAPGPAPEAVDPVDPDDLDPDDLAPLDASAGFGVTASGDGDFLVPLDPPAEAAHARRTMIGRSAEEVDHAPPRGRYAPEQVPDSGGAGAALRWVAPAAALAIAGAVVVGRALRRRR
ncbi:SRPBCC domain-containing protein [Streptomyces sp. NBC_01506]|uniref:SRPBCC domain-containing protein n=1 Tax=Streptomyces sp. NBC_01506 TaxID=2903887 RepID=UPI00386A6EB9